MPSALRVLLVLLLTLPLLAQTRPAPPPKDYAELQQRILTILQETKTPGAGVVIADRNGIRWTAGLGLANVAERQPATADTLFRIGSITKMWVGLAALKLQSEGRLDLDAPLRSLAPEVAFANPWEATDPVRIVHLLQHTAGWDDLRFRDYAHNDPRPATLKEGLDFDPRSRTSRWKPGTRFSYCNSGPAVVAYVIQKITGRDFEDYVGTTFLQPTGMGTASFRLTPATDQRLTRLYADDGRTVLPYWHILMRPAGALNASAREMGAFLQFLLNRGRVKDQAILPAGALDRMETPTTTSAARAGLRTGYGLHNYTTLDDEGFVWHGHNGGVEGGLSELAYLPDEGVGYFSSINSGNGDAYERISKLMKAYVTQGLKKPEPPPAVRMPVSGAWVYDGWYQGVSPRNQVLQFLERILDVRRVDVAEKGFTVRPLLGGPRLYLAVTPFLFRREKHSQATAVLLPEEGMIQIGGTTLRPIPAWLVWAQAGGAALALLAMAASLLFALVWVPRKLLGRMRQVRHLSVRVWPLVTTLVFGATLGLFALGQNDFLARFGNPTPWSIGITVLTSAFALAAPVSLWKVLRVPRREMKRGVYLLCLLTAGMTTLLTIYLALHGMIGWRSWA